MRSYLQMFLRGVFLVGFVASFAVWQRQENQWKYLVFTQQWPAASCIDINVSPIVCFLVLLDYLLKEVLLSN